MDNNKKLWTILEIANETGVTKTTVTRKIRELGISYVRLESNKQYYRYEDVAKILDILNPKEKNTNFEETEKTEENEKTEDNEETEQTATDDRDKSRTDAKSRNVAGTNHNNTQQVAVSRELYERIIKGLEERVEAQEKQIKDQNDIISNLLEKNDQLTARNVFLISQQSQIVVNDEEQEQQEEKKTLWQRLFK